MRTLFVGMVVAFVLSFPVAGTRAGQSRPAVQSEGKMLRVRQKQESKALKLQQKYQKRSWKGAHLSKATRAQMKHQMQRDKRAVREKQRDERQDLKDRQRQIKERPRQVY